MKQREQALAMMIPHQRKFLFELAYPTDASLCIRDHFSVEECQRRCGHLVVFGLVARHIENIWTGIV